MDRKLRHVLIFLLIILKEPNMPEAGCYCRPSWCNCRKEDLTSIPQNLPTSISEIMLTNNQITAISSGAFSNLPKLEKMPLSRNQIATIPSGAIANLPKLQELYMTHNQVKYIPSGTFANLTQLQVLFLFHNQITTIESGAFANLTQLQTLALDQNQITTIPSGTFANLPKLQRLGLSYNQITTINSGAFENLPLLNGLGLRNNKMTAIPLSVFCFLPSTIKIELGRNPWQCDCKMAPFKLIHEFKNQIICAQPAKLQGQKLAHVDPKELICKEPTISPLTVHSSSAAVSTSSWEEVGFGREVVRMPVSSGRRCRNGRNDTMYKHTRSSCEIRVSEIRVSELYTCWPHPGEVAGSQPGAP
ncbi:PREDICTED: carboxypeptidase N subunit 2-like [Branchiostoma belcheri]|uniref:Carboxypeptidase N subunit 2-like n=1 Tax=Branchiostoma belcheri TaxID=7741 RepID=A0A6P4ZTP6_BRABE|nr:PREDICTED: carboxypeptidase N subunit 2-like [Branchiostoma belcheri]